MEAEEAEESRVSTITGQQSMRRLAIEGGKPLVHPAIKPLQTIGRHEQRTVCGFMRQVADGKATLSGYLAGSERGGSAVQRLEEIWAHEFGVRHAIACNSGTSAIFAACATVGVKDKRVIVPALGMSAAAAAPAILGGKVEFADVDHTFCIDHTRLNLKQGDRVIAVNLFGHPAALIELRQACDQVGAILIEDNAQAPWAMDRGKYTGTIGHIGCWSFNCHKPVQAGEGGMCTTDDDFLAKRLRGFVNHGEVSGQDCGLNLRMPELTAVILITQMQRAKKIVEQRRKIAKRLTTLIGEDKNIVLPEEMVDTVSSWYCYAMLAPTTKARDWVVKALNAEGVPVRSGYTIIPRLSPALIYCGNTASRAWYGESHMFLLELCSIDPTSEQIEQMAEAIRSIGAIMPC